ncbi:hypothetical protein P1X14_19575 [Sphingomonas sp. AOB5]|uniref:hypothetical protein n=1 Tax=Sphingomonas sp. AOB5 TaxID=3034017 RepID=UPI0023F9B3A6|nr:hypothetical protein [Sphingomonas sp. AOB5]MDF7777467.1 hypothetical protein [Sphingomonas sp. AOB5]
MRLKLLFTALLMLLPVPALADVTARYSAGEKNELVVMVDDGGNYRAEVTGAVILIRRDGVSYIAVKNAKGEFVVTRTEALLEMLSAQLKPFAAQAAAKADPKMKFSLLPGNSNETVAGRTGALWRFGPVKPDTAEAERNKDLLEFVMSADPLLAPVGRVFHDMFGIIAPVAEIFLGEADLTASGKELLGKGAPLRVGNGLKLTSVDSADIAASQFELPGAELEPMEFFEAVGPDAGARAMPKLH